MPEEAARQIHDQLKDADFMVPAEKADVSNLAVIHALRTAADGMKRLGEQQDRISSKIDTVSEGVHGIDKRLAIIEANSLTSKVKDIDERVTLLEESEHKRQGAVGLFDWVGRSWPNIIAFVALVVYVVLNEGGRL